MMEQGGGSVMEVKRADKIGPFEKMRSERGLSGREGVGQLNTWEVGIPPVQVHKWPASKAPGGSVPGGAGC